MRIFWKSICVIGLICGTATSDLTINTSMKAGSAAAPTAPPAGTGTLGAIVDAAAAHWENLIHDNVTIDIQYRWLQLDSSLGQAFVDPGDPPPIISFDIDTTWFMDSTPTDHSEYGPKQTKMIDSLSTGEYFENGMGDALSFDLFTVALHEIGHVLAGVNNFAEPIVIASPLPAPGLMIQTTPTSQHLNSETAFYPESLMGDSLVFGRRRLVSDYDLLAVAQTGGFTSVSAVPEPSPMLYLSLIGAVVGSVGVYRKRSRLTRRNRQS